MLLGIVNGAQASIGNRISLQSRKFTDSDGSVMMSGRGHSHWHQHSHLTLVKCHNGLLQLCNAFVLMLIAFCLFIVQNRKFQNGAKPYKIENEQGEATLSSFVRDP